MHPGGLMSASELEFITSLPDFAFIDTEQELKAEIIVRLACASYRHLDKHAIIKSTRESFWNVQDAVSFLSSNGYPDASRFVAEAQFCYRAMDWVKFINPYEFERARIIDQAIVLCEVIAKTFYRLIENRSIYAERLAALILKQHVDTEDQAVTTALFADVIAQFKAVTRPDAKYDFLLDKPRK